MPEIQLWKRIAERYSVEIRVGDTWVVHDSYDNLSAAEAGARKVVLDASVRAARVCALKTVQSYAIVSETEKPLDMPTPKGFTPTGDLVPCRACGAKEQRVVKDATQTWVFCTACKRAYPC